MKNLKQIIEDANESRKVIWHFNVSNLEILKAVFNIAKKHKQPVIVGVSEGERKFIGAKMFVTLVRSLREEFNFPIFSNADHCRSLESFKEAVDTGFDAVIFDGASLDLEENIKITKKCVEYARQINKNILVEGELGYIGETSNILDKIPEGVEIVSSEDAKKFVEETGVDLFAPAVGNIHGILKNSSNPRLEIKKIKEIKEAVKIPLILHGGSGVKNEDFISAASAGISIIHISTEIRIAYRKGLESFLENNPDEIVPYKISANIVEEVEKAVENKLKIFSV